MLAFLLYSVICLKHTFKNKYKITPETVTEEKDIKSNEPITFNNGYLAVVDCDTLDSVKLNDALKGQPKEYIKKIVILNCNLIVDSLFSGCISLTEIHLNCNKIGSAAFYSCVNLREVTISKCDEIGYSAFYGCSSLNTVKYENTIEPTHGNDVFKECPNLKTVYVPEGYNGDKFCEILVAYIPTPTPIPPPTSAPIPPPTFLRLLYTKS